MNANFENGSYISGMFILIAFSIFILINIPVSSYHATLNVALKRIFFKSAP